MPIWIDAPQGSDSWLLHRIGVLTASRVDAAMATTKTGMSEKRRKLMLDIAAERLTGKMTETFVNDAMKWGIRYEAEAREVYENQTGNIVQLCGLAMHDTIPHFGASPDGLIGDDMVWECKCPTTATFISYCLADEVPEQYRPQMMAQMICTGRKAGIFTAYDPRMPERINLFIKEFVPSEDDLAKVKNAAIQFNAEVEEMITKLKKTKEI